mgnify:CR=1 FL=1
MKRTLLILISIISVSFTDQIEFERFTIDNGLSQNTVYEVFQDSRGYIWMGTQGGLDRYNGYEFKKYEHESTDSTTIIKGWIYSINEDEDGIIWIGTQDGNFGWFDPYEEVAGEIDLYKNHPEFERPLRIDKILFHKDNIYLATIGSGLCRYNRTNGSTTWYMEDSTASHYIKERVFNDIFLLSENEIVFADNKIIVLNTETNKHTTPYSDVIEDQLGIPSDSISITNIARDDKGNWYMGTWNNNGLIVFNIEKQTASQYFPLPKDQKTGKRPRTAIKEVVIGKNGNVWISLWNIGMAIFNPKTKEFDLHRPEQKNPTSISDTQLESFLVDRSGGVWVGGSRSLMKHDPEKKKFNLIANSPKADIKTSFSDFWGLFVDKNQNIWAGSVFRGNGVEKINLKTKEVVNYTPKSAKNGRGVSLWFLREDPDGRIWGRTNYDLFVLNKDSKIFTTTWDISNVSFKETGPIRQFMLDSENRFWVFSRRKSWWVSHEGDSIVWTDVATKHKSMKGIINIMGNTESKDGRFFLLYKSWDGSQGITDQLLKVSNTSFKVDTLYDHESAKNKIPGFDGSITSLFESRDGFFWITTYGEGVTRYDIKTGDFKHYGIKDGLPNSYIYSIYEDNFGHMWMSSNYGILKLNPKDETFRQFGMADGIQNFEYNQSSNAQMADGTLLFGGLSGVNYFNPNTLKDNPNEPTVIIESFSKTDSVFMLHKSNRSNETYNVYYNEKDLSFRFAAIDYRNPSQNEHAYMMDGYDTDWHYSGGRRYASYTNLPPGNYTFMVKGSNNDGMWNETGASLSLRIHPAPWETTWAYLFYFATAGFGVFGYVKRQRKLHVEAMEQARKEEELEEARQFQLDMLPDEMPEMLNLDIAATIQTASEVGGDYYDFFPQSTGESLYIVVGDATGHGMTAGMMVSITKAGLYGIPSIPPNDIATRLNRVIKNIDLGWNRMAINVARVWEDRVEFTSAAMPPLYQYHAQSGDVDEILLEGLPLGSIKGEKYSLVELEFKKGDSLVFISDGLPEATNSSNNMLGYKAVLDCVKINGDQSAEKQKEALLNLGSTWLGDIRNQDDITIVVVKKTR